MAHPAAAAAQGPACATNWGTGAKTAGSMVTTRVRAVTAGQHACFDRLVIRMGAGTKPGYTVRYVSSIVDQGSGKTIPVKGKGKLSITVRAPARAGFPAGDRRRALVLRRHFVILGMPVAGAIPRACQLRVVAEVRSS